MIDVLLLFIYTVAAFGFAYVVGHSVITREIRTRIADGMRTDSGFRFYFLTLLECPMCVGWWTGASTGVALVAWYGWPLVTVVVAAFYTCGMNFVLGRATGLVSNPQSET